MLARGHCRPSRASKSSASFAALAFHFVKCRHKRRSGGRLALWQFEARCFFASALEPRIV
jgi:hypothetical protein